MSVEFDLPKIFDDYIIRFLQGFPFLIVERVKLDEKEAIFSIKVKELNKDYLITIKEVEK